MTTYPVRTRRWSRSEYEHLIEAGIFHPGEPVELLGGDLIVSEPQGSAHCTAIILVTGVLRGVLDPGWLVRSQGPVALDPESEPEPDVSVVAGAARDYSLEHPARPVLVVEVSESSLAHDRHYKESLYARARLDEYWIVNLVDRVLEVSRRPVADAAAPFGWRYESIQMLAADSFVTPLVAPGARIPVRDLLP